MSGRVEQCRNACIICVHFSREQPVINSETVSIDYLGSLPEGTFGKEYWKFLSKNVSFDKLLIQNCIVMLQVQSY